MKKILIIDDHELVAESINAALRNEFEVITANSAIEMRSRLQESAFALVVMDLDLSDGSSGIDLLPELKEQNIPVIILSGTATIEDLRVCVGLGIKGFVPKRKGGSEKVVKAVHGVIAGYSVFPDGFFEDLRLMDEDAIPHMSQRERDVLDQLLSLPIPPDNDVIAENLHVSVGRVANLMSFLYVKFEIKDRAGRHVLVAEARRRGYYPLKKRSVPLNAGKLVDQQGNSPSL
jgi:DNA-binding NarL/FixJ family response regulator